MGPMRSLFLRASRSTLLARRLPRRAFVQRAVRRFLPGETADDALAAATVLVREGIGSLYTKVGENVSTMAEAEHEVVHYMEVMDRAQALGLSSWPSIKPTHLGLDLDRAACERHLLRLVAHAQARETFLWIDMEDSSYVDVTLDLYERARAAYDRVGLALQAYLRRTPADLERLLPLAPAIRLVKGAYAEPPDVAFPSRRNVDEQYFVLGRRLLDAARDGRTLPVFGTHDTKLIARLRAHAAAEGLPPNAYEFHLLYGIRTDEQRRLAADGASVRVLISYGRDWFPWYMRRLAERPANVWFVVRHLAG